MTKDTEPAKPSAKLVQVNGLEEYTIGIPVFLATTDGKVNTKELVAPMSYVLSGEGTFLYRTGPVFTTFTETEGMAGLGEVEGEVLYQFSPIPARLAEQVIGFFQWAEVTYGTEAIVLMYYNATKKEWRIECPKQKVSMGAADYEVPNSPEGFVRLGTWHSHGSMSAYHSSVDHHDEVNDDGLHITSGNLSGTPNFKSSISCSIMMSGTRYSLDANAVFRNLEVIEATTTSSVKYIQGIKTVEPGRTEFRIVSKTEDDLSFPEEWKDLLEAKPKAPFGFGVTRSASGVGSEFGSFDEYYGVGTFRAPKKVECECWHCMTSAHASTIGYLANTVKWLRNDDNAEARQRVIHTKIFDEDGAPDFLPEYSSEMDILKGILKGGSYRGQTVTSPKAVALMVAAMRREELGDRILQLEEDAKSCSTSLCLNVDGFWSRDVNDELIKVPSMSYNESAGPCSEFLPIPFTSAPQAASKEYGEKMGDWASEHDRWSLSNNPLSQTDDVAEDVIRLCGNCEILTLEGGLNLPAADSDCPILVMTGKEPGVFSDAAEKCDKFRPVEEIEWID